MSYGQYNPYQQGPAVGEDHEMQGYGQPYDQTPAPAVHVMTQQDFLSRVQYVRNEIRSLTADVRQVAQLHGRVLSGSDTALSGSGASPQDQLDALVAQTQLKNTRIRDQIRALKTDTEHTTDGSRGLKTRQFDALNSDFKKELQGYLQEEQDYKRQYREQIARQYLIVNPEATEQEVNQAADADWGNEGIFQTALRTNRSGHASAVLGAVRARHNELQKIEQSIAELAMLFQDLDTLVVQQEATVLRAEEQTEQTNVHLNKGNEQVEVGIGHARRARKLKWWCLLVVVLICIAIALGVGLGITLTRNQTKAATGS